MIKKKSILFYIGIAITFAFIGYAFLKMDLRKAMEVLYDINLIWAIPLTLVFYFNFYLRSLRWWYIIEPTKPIPVKNLFSALSIGFMGNMIFPMRIGEFVRAYVIAKKEKISTSGAFATVVLERVFDVVSILILLLIVMLIADPPAMPADTWQKLKMGGIVFTLAIFCMISVLYFLADGDSALSGKFANLMRYLPGEISQKAKPLIESFRGGLKVLRKGGHLLGIIAHSFTVWFTIVISYYLFVLLFNVEASWGMACMVTLFTVFGVAIPSSPGFVGPFHAAIVLALGFYGIDIDQALGMAIFIHLYIFLAIVGLGVICLMREKMSLSEIQHSAD